ncbi:MAG: Mur ligase family protein, partial [Halobacteria archaeon]|nr:Mur ligase family protein [Halobacteria archaeon]
MNDGTKPRDAVRYLFRLRRFGVKKGFERVERLLRELGNPHEEFDAVQIGGTNGKGSVGRMLESCLLDAGHDVGLYTSPHLLELGERVRVGGERTRKRRIAEFVERVRPCVEEMIAEGNAPTFFEVTTVMAFDEFARRGVDIGVLEVGLGGRFDTTSVCDTDVSAVTSVDREHTDVLGEDVEEIAWELGHVIPEDGTCVTGAEGEALEVLRSMADERDANLVEVGEDIEYDEPNRDGFEQVLGIRTRVSEYEGARLPLLGEHQARNACVAVGLLESVSESLGYDVDDGNVLSGLRTADLPGRFEVVGTDPLVVLDGAHNPAAIDALAETLADFEHDELGVVFGAM